VWNRLWDIRPADGCFLVAFGLLSGCFLCFVALVPPRMHFAVAYVVEYFAV
jgi:hypothetical protein